MFFRLLIIFIILAIAGAVFYGLNPSDDNSASPLLRGLGKVKSLTQQATSEAPVETVVYKWQDKNGEWHFSNHPPPEGTVGSITTYRSDINVVAPPQAESPPTQESPAAKPADNPGIPSLLPITDPDRVKKLINDAKNVQNLADDRQHQLDQTIDRR